MSDCLSSRNLNSMITIILILTAIMQFKQNSSINNHFQKKLWNLKQGYYPQILLKC